MTAIGWTDNMHGGSGHHHNTSNYNYKVLKRDTPASRTFQPLHSPILSTHAFYHVVEMDQA